MVKQPKTAHEAGKPGPERARSESRQARLEAALRENLKRRKQQSRSRTGAVKGNDNAATQDRKDPGQTNDS